jgi:tRNA-modifying protein YgfZ
MAALNPFVCIEFHGEGARSALHGQCTQDLLSLTGSEARLAAFCNPKGRMRGAGRILALPDQLVLITARDQAEALLAHLTPVLRLARVEAMISERTVVLIGETSTGGTIGQVTHHGAVVQVQEYGGTQWVLGDSSVAHQETADLARLHAGFAMLHAPIADQLIPQQAHYQMLGGVSFSKGCYTGQEIIARLEHLGEAKKVLKIHTSDFPLHIGETIDLDGHPQLLVCDAATDGTEHTALLLAPVGAKSEQLRDVPFEITRQVAGERPVKR